MVTEILADHDRDERVGVTAPMPTPAPERRQVPTPES